MPPWSISFPTNEHMHTKERHITGSWLPCSCERHLETEREKHLLGNGVCMKHRKKGRGNSGQSKKEGKKTELGKSRENLLSDYYSSIRKILFCCLPPLPLVLFHRNTEELFLASLKSVSGFSLERQEGKECKDKSWLTFKLYLQYRIARNGEQKGEQKPEMRIFLKNFRKYSGACTLIAII